jgi:outer membrane protein W
VIAVLGTLAVHAQGNFMISYPISFPTGDLKNYSSNTSFRGISMEFNKKTSPNMTAGLEVGWNVFYQHVDKKVYTDGNASIAGVTYRYTNAVPMIAGAKWYAKNKKGTRTPYFGLGLGTTYVNRSTDFGLYRISTDAWQFCLRPEIGFDFKIAQDESLFIGAKYFYNFNTSQLNGQNWISVNFGFRSGF